MRKILLILIALLSFSLVSCDKNKATQYGQTKEGVAYENYLNDRFDSSIFYKNYGSIIGADPSVITVGDEYYLYVTNADGKTDCSFIQAYKSKNLIDWEWLGRVFIPNRDAWAVSSLWAPEVVKKDEKYYMYYSGFDIEYQCMGIGVAVSDSPSGPFKEYSGTLEDGTVIDHTTSPFNYVLKEYREDFKCIDPSVFLDDDGKVYLYLSQDQVKRESSVYGMELANDMVSIKKETIVGPLVTAEQSWESKDATKKWNEAPFMVKHDGKYYLTYSANYYASSLYGLGYAVSDYPLGEFSKPKSNPLLQAKEEWPFLSGPGHCSFFKSADGSELFIAYHSHKDVGEAGAVRKINFDRVSFVDGEMVVNGPSTTPQLLPSGSSEYKNITSLASLNSSDASILTDGVVNSYYDRVDTHELYFDSKTSITFTFDSEVNIKAILVYDSADYQTSLNYYELKFSKDKVKRVYSNSNYKYIDEFGYEIKLPATASIIQFTNIKTKTVTLTFESGTSISEIVIVGGEA